MLNELIEFENYTYSLDSNEPVYRLKHKNLSNSLSGVTRAMTIIARKCYYDENVIDKIGHCKNTLRVWCGDPKGDQPASRVCEGGRERQAHPRFISGADSDGDRTLS